MTRGPRRQLQPEGRSALADLYGECDAHEFLQCVAGLVAHNVADFATAELMQSLIRLAARFSCKTAAAEKNDPVRRNTALRCAEKALRNLNHALGLLADEEVTR